MKRLNVVMVLALGLVVVGGAVAATKGDAPGRGMYGATAVATAAATKVFTGMGARNSVFIFNNGPNTIWCGYDSAVTNVNGTPVSPSSALNIDVTAGTELYCRADTALQVSPADTRWMQVR